MKPLNIVLLLSLVLVSACSSRPPHYGVFLKQGGRLAEMEQGAGGPPDPAGIPSTTDRKPAFVFWVPNTQLNFLILTKRSASQQFKFDMTPKSDGRLEVMPRTELSSGTYCFVAGNMMLSPTMIPNWCFIVK